MVLNKYAKYVSFIGLLIFFLPIDLLAWEYAWNDYRESLTTNINDAKKVSQILERKYGFETKILIDPNRSTILRAINDFRRRLEKSDHFLIYYAGHGTFDKTVGKAYWLPIDAERDSDAQWIIVDSITSNLKRIACNHVLIVSDSCYSGTLTRSALSDLESNQKRDQYLKKMLKRSSRTLLASGGNEPVADSGGKGHSVFAQAFIDGLHDMDKKVFTAEELYYEYIKEVVAGNAEQIPEYNTIRNSGHKGGDFLFFRRD